VNRGQVIGRNVYRLRLHAGLTQTQLADFTQLSKRYIQKIEHGKANVTVEVIERMARIFRCSWTDVVGKMSYDKVTAVAKTE
jgi:transcriptional regulator with XRE-family HTH domain